MIGLSSGTTWTRCRSFVSCRLREQFRQGVRVRMIAMSRARSLLLRRRCRSRSSCRRRSSCLLAGLRSKIVPPPQYSHHNRASSTPLSPFLYLFAFFFFLFSFFLLSSFYLSFLFRDFRCFSLRSGLSFRSFSFYAPMVPSLLFPSLLFFSSLSLSL